MIPFLIRTVCIYGGFVAAEIATGLYKEWKVRRDLTRYENSEGGQIDVHHVTKDTEGPVTTVGGTGIDVKEGDILVATDRPDVYQPVSNLDGYEPLDSEVEDTAEDETSAEDDGEFPYDPAEHNVPEVLQYLSDADPEERKRVIAAERSGKGRVSITDFNL